MRFVGAIRVALIALIVLIGVSASATEPGSGAYDETARRLFTAGVIALEQGAWSEAIAQYEKLADNGFLHPDASFNRAMAYVERARSPQAKAGDLGRASAALAETLLLRPDDAKAEEALERLHEEIARRRASRGAEPVAMSASLGRAIVGLLSEDTWAAGAAAGSLLLTLGLTISLWRTHVAARLAGMISAGLGVVLLSMCGTLAVAARHLRMTEAPAVVVASEARLLDERAVPLSAAAALLVPEGAEVEVLEERAGLARIMWGKTAGWVLRNQLRVLPRP